MNLFFCSVLRFGCCCFIVYNTFLSSCSGRDQTPQSSTLQYSALLLEGENVSHSQVMWLWQALDRWTWQKPGRGNRNIASTKTLMTLTVCWCCRLYWIFIWILFWWEEKQKHHPLHVLSVLILHSGSRRCWNLCQLCWGKGYNEDKPLVYHRVTQSDTRSCLRTIYTVFPTKHTWFFQAFLDRACKNIFCILSLSIWELKNFRAVVCCLNQTFEAAKQTCFPSL